MEKWIGKYNDIYTEKYYDKYNDQYNDKYNDKYNNKYLHAKEVVGMKFFIEVNEECFPLRRVTAVRQRLQLLLQPLHHLQSQFADRNNATISKC